MTDSMGLALRCTSCGGASISSLFYLGAEAHVCRHCGSDFELMDPLHDRRSGADRRGYDRQAADWAEWRSGEDRRRALSADPRRRARTPSAA